MLRKEKRGKLAVWAVTIVALVLGMVACGPAAPPAAEATPTQPSAQPSATAPSAEATPTSPPEPKKGGTLVFGQISDAYELGNPPKSGGLTSYYPINEMFERLVVVQADGSQRPQLAESWESSEDLLSWTFHLREGVKFHDGTPFDAEAVRFTYEDRLMNPDHSLVAAQYQAGIKDVEVVDDHTVRFHLNYVNSHFIAQLVSDMRAVMMSPAAAEKYGEDLALHPVGTGPFRFVEWVPDEQIVLERNEEYWGGPPNLDRIIYKVVPDTQTQLIELEEGTLHISWNFPFEHLQELEENPEIRVESGVQNATYGLWFNTQRAPFDDVRVRKAVTLAVDVDTIVETVAAGLMDRAEGPVPVSVSTHDPTLEIPKYDPEEAKRILAELGWEPGPDGILQKDGQPFTVHMIWTEVVTSKDKEIGEVVQRYLTELGLDVRMELMDWSTFSPVRRDRDYDICWMQVGPRPPDPALTTLDLGLRCGALLNDSDYCNEDFDAIMLEAASTIDPEEQARLYSEAQQMAIDGYAGIYIGNTYMFMAIRDEVKDFTFHPGTYMGLLATAYIGE